MPNKCYQFAINPSSGAPLQSGQLDAESIEVARTALARLLGHSHLPNNTVLIDKTDVDAEGETAWQSVLAMLADRVAAPAAETGPDEIMPTPVSNYIHRILTDHHEWLRNADKGARANLSGMNLPGIDLSGRDLSHADITDANLSGADLSKAVLIGTNLTRASLRGANLRGADLERADLSDADLRDTVLLDANLKNTDLWRANIRGIVIKARTLHKAFECRTK